MGDDEENDGEDIDEQQQQNADEESDSDYDDDNESELTENDELAMIHRQQQQQPNNNQNEQKLLQRKKPAKASSLKANAARNTELNLCPEMMNDKIFNMDFKKWSKEFTQSVSTQNASAFQRVISMLNESDKNILKKILN